MRMREAQTIEGEHTNITGHLIEEKERTQIKLDLIIEKAQAHGLDVSEMLKVVDETDLD